MPKPAKTYVGIDNDVNGGMTDTGKIIRDAWVFELIPEIETCEGWQLQGIESLWSRVDAEWEKYGFRVANLPTGLRERFLRIHGKAIEQAKSSGWSAENELAGD